jgi:ATP-dependent RNA helicase RhlE
MNQLKKINPNLLLALQEANLSEANELQRETFSALKSGANTLVVSPQGTGKSTTVVMAVIQQLATSGEESPRALIMVRDKAALEGMTTLFSQLNTNNRLTVFGVHDKGDLEYDKNFISGGIDVLVGTPDRLNEMFSTAGYNVNRLKMFILDDADLILKDRHEPKLLRLLESIPKPQRILFATEYSERLELFAEKVMDDPEVFDFTE